MCSPVMEYLYNKSNTGGQKSKWFQRLYWARNYYSEMSNCGDLVDGSTIPCSCVKFEALRRRWELFSKTTCFWFLFRITWNGLRFPIFFLFVSDAIFRLYSAHLTGVDSHNNNTFVNVQSPFNDSSLTYKHSILKVSEAHVIFVFHSTEFRN